MQILRLNRGVLDETVFDEWAPALGVDALLEKARVAAQNDEGPGD